MLQKAIFTSTNRCNQVELFEARRWEAIDRLTKTMPDHSLNTKTRVERKTQEIHETRNTREREREVYLGEERGRERVINREDHRKNPGIAKESPFRRSGKPAAPIPPNILVPLNKCFKPDLDSGILLCYRNADLTLATFLYLNTNDLWCASSKKEDNISTFKQDIVILLTNFWERAYHITS
jgi:hypothetical protein